MKDGAKKRRAGLIDSWRSLFAPLTLPPLGGAFWPSSRLTIHVDRTGRRSARCCTASSSRRSTGRRRASGRAESRTVPSRTIQRSHWLGSPRSGQDQARRQSPLHRQNPTSLYLEFSGSDAASPKTGSVALRKGPRCLPGGMAFRKGEALRFSMYQRGDCRWKSACLARRRAARKASLPRRAAPGKELR